MSEQTHEEALEDRLFNKIVARVQDEMDFGNVKSQNKQIDQLRVETMRSSTPINTNTTWFRIGNGAIVTKVPSDDDPSVFQLLPDLYAILATAPWRSIPFWLSLFIIIGFQYLLLILLLVNLFNISSDNNPWNVPANVENSVRISQGLLIVIALFSQGDLLAGIESLVSGLPHQCRGNRRFVSMTKSQWRLSAIVQLIQGLLNFLASLVLAVQSETVADILLNVLGVGFISNLDELAFRLCVKGYLGGSMKKFSKDVCDARFYRVVNTQMSMPILKRKLKKEAHIISAFAVVLAGLGVFKYFAIKQHLGEYLEQDILIEFGDEVLPFLGLFNGCYQISKSNDRFDGRLVYEQAGYPNGGKFGFCSDFGEGDGGWTFFIGEQGDICGENSYILRSGETSTFSLLEAGKTKWYTSDDLPMDYLEITEIKAPDTECGQSIFDISKDACPSIMAFGTTPMKRLSPSANLGERAGRRLDASVSHPIYYSNANGKGSFELIFFTGRRWIRTKSDHISGLGNETSVPYIEDFFFSTTRPGLFKIIDKLRTPVDEESELVIAVSEIVETARDQGSPLGLLWYLPRYKANIIDFPSANMARPIDLVLKCLVCNDETNPCMNDGICDSEKGTCGCKYGATGELCQEPPSGNGICNLYFNTAEYAYDGGDCCGGTCKGEDCGIKDDDLPDPFSGLADAYYILDEDGYPWYQPFHNKTEEWNGREFAYGVDIDGNEDLLMEFNTPPRRFKHCVDPNTVPLTLGQKGMVNLREPGTTMLAETTVRCDGSPYVQVTRFEIPDYLPNHIFKEEVRVPYGARCEFRVWDNETEISIFFENSPLPFVQRQGENYGGPISVRIPKSDCVWDAFVEYQIPPVFTESQYREFAGGVDLDSICHRDKGEVLDRYAIWKIIKSLSGTSKKLDGHVCEKENYGSLKLTCTDDQLRVSELWDIRGDALPSEIWSLTQLTALDLQHNQLTSISSEVGWLASLRELYLDNNNLVSLPSEIGRLTSLAVLNIRGNQLTTLPPEIGSLISLRELYLDDNQLTLIPSEIGRLNTSLAELHLMKNQLTWIPSELGRLTSLTKLDLGDNNLTWNLPTEIGRLTLLEELYLDKNNLESIPSEIGMLKALTTLSLDYNPITWDELPTEVQDLQLEGTEIDVCDFEIGEDGCIPES